MWNIERYVKKYIDLQEGIWKKTSTSPSCMLYCAVINECFQMEKSEHNIQEGTSWQIITLFLSECRQSGKVQLVIAKRLGYRFVDTDILIQESEGKLLKDIIADVGPDGFLKVEDRVNAQVKAERTVISPGGSVVYCENAMKHYKEIGKVVYLQASFETINSRIKNAKGRGVVLRDGQTLKDLYDERVKLFEKYADITVCEDNQKLEDTIESVLDALGE